MFNQVVPSRWREEPAGAGGSGGRAEHLLLRDLAFGRTFPPPRQLWGEPRGTGGQHPPPGTCGPGLLHPFSKSAQFSLPLHPPCHFPLGSGSPKDAGRDLLPQGRRKPWLVRMGRCARAVMPAWGGSGTLVVPFPGASLQPYHSRALRLSHASGHQGMKCGCSWLR